VVPGRRALVLEGGTGRISHVLPGLAGGFRAADLDGDGLPELVGYQAPSEGGYGQPTGRLHLYRGLPPTVWQRLGWWWYPTGDANADGTDDLTAGEWGPVVCGRTGRILFRRLEQGGLHRRPWPTRPAEELRQALSFEEGRLVSREGEGGPVRWRSSCPLPPQSVVEAVLPEGEGASATVVVRAGDDACNWVGVDAATGKAR
jgi:hypothetical protein